jgi:ribosomal protein L25 (general stress protein Ctc)
MSTLKTNDEIVKLLWSTIKDTMIYILKEDAETFESVFKTNDYNGILELKNNSDNEMIPIDCYGSDNDGNEFELTDKHLDQLYTELKENGNYHFDPSTEDDVFEDYDWNN